MSTTNTKTKPKTISKDMAQRSIFSTAQEVAAFLSEVQEYEGFESLQHVIHGLQSDGSIDFSVYPAGWDIYVVKLNEKITTKMAEVSGEESGFRPKAIIVWPVPSLELLMASEAGQELIAQTMQTELNTRLVRQLRTSENIVADQDAIPTTLDEWTAIGRAAMGSIYESYNELWTVLNKAMCQASSYWDRAKLTKMQVRKSMESTAYAEQLFPTLENHPKHGSLFVFALQAAKHLAGVKGLDDSIFDKWLANRDATKIDAGDSDDDDELDVGEMFAGMLADDDESEEAAVAE
jgi:hypothetical protein